jgi:hypothetical protein
MSGARLHGGSSASSSGTERAGLFVETAAGPFRAVDALVPEPAKRETAVRTDSAASFKLEFIRMTPHDYIIAAPFDRKYLKTL